MIYPQTVTYALDALCHLARCTPGAYVKVREISADLGIPQHFLGKVMSQLVRKKLLVSSKGPTGGVALKKDPGEVTVADVLSALGASEYLEDKCVLGLGDCSDQNACPFHTDWGEFKSRIGIVARETTLAALAGQVS